MDVTADPIKLKNFTEQDMNARSKRTKVAMLDFIPGADIRRVNLYSSAELSTALQEPQDKSKNVKGRLFVVEDLSSEVIEALGAKFDIDPLFFRNQIGDYMWSNPKDPWVELPSLDLVAKARSFFCIRYFQARYFRDTASFNSANNEAGAFNVLRRMDNNRPWEGTPDFDTPESDIGLVRSKMSLWVRTKKQSDEMVLGILVVDPTINQGFPLWGGYQNFQDCPSMHEPIQSRKIPPRTSLFEEAIYWTSTLTTAEIDDLPNDPKIFIKKALLTVCAEWTTVVKYLTTRLTQLEWELEHTPVTPFRHPKGLDVSLNSLNMWRRRMPVYQEWVSETFTRVISPTTFMGSTKNATAQLKGDFEKLQSGLEGAFQRSDRIESSVAAMISIQENKKAMLLNQSAARLTYLAVIFVPLSWVTGFFSMQPDVTALKETFWIYFICAVPLLLIALVVLKYSTILDGFSKIKNTM